MCAEDDQPRSRERPRAPLLIRTDKPWRQTQQRGRASSRLSTLSFSNSPRVHLTEQSLTIGSFRVTREGCQSLEQPMVMLLNAEDSFDSESDAIGERILTLESAGVPQMLQSTRSILPISPVFYDQSEACSEVSVSRPFGESCNQTPMETCLSSSGKASPLPLPLSPASRQGRADDELAKGCFSPLLRHVLHSMRYDDLCLLELLDEGGFSKVYWALHTLTNRFVAVKQINVSALSEPGPNLSGQSNFKKSVSSQSTSTLSAPTAASFAPIIGSSFRPNGLVAFGHCHESSAELHRLVHRELSAVHTQYKSSHVVKTYNAFFVDSQLTIVSELMNCGSLKRILERVPGRSLPERLVAVLMEQVLIGLRDVHSLSIVHNDIKPANILLSGNGAAKLADFGSAKVLADDFSEDAETVGTQEYMSPERLRGVPWRMAGDIWALGIVAAESVLGEHPFRDDASDVFERSDALERDPFNGKKRLNLSRSRCDDISEDSLWEKPVSASFARFVRRMTNPSPHKRPSADKLLRDPFLTEWSSSFDVAAALSEFLLAPQTPMGISGTGSEIFSPITNTSDW